MGIYQCFKPYTDCRNYHRYKNGKTPLELDGVSTKGLDWVRFALHNSPINIMLH